MVMGSHQVVALEVEEEVPSEVEALVGVEEQAEDGK
jgi:hypothetical protein